jgi:hypothetical protein
MTRVGFEPTIAVFELAKTFHALDRAALCSALSVAVTGTWMVDQVALEHNLLPVSLVFPANHYSTIAPYSSVTPPSEI